MWVLIVLGTLVVVAVGFMFYRSMFVTFEKPAIYLYPTEDSRISVKLDVKGRIFNDLPKYGNGWNVFVTKE